MTKQLATPGTMAYPCLGSRLVGFCSVAVLALRCCQSVVVTWWCSSLPRLLLLHTHSPPGLVGCLGLVWVFMRRGAGRARGERCQPAQGQVPHRLGPRGGPGRHPQRQVFAAAGGGGGSQRGRGRRVLPRRSGEARYLSTTHLNLFRLCFEMDKSLAFPRQALDCVSIGLDQLCLVVCGGVVCAGGRAVHYHETSAAAVAAAGDGGGGEGVAAAFGKACVLTYAIAEDLTAALDDLDATAAAATAAAAAAAGNSRQPSECSEILAAQFLRKADVSPADRHLYARGSPQSSRR